MSLILRVTMAQQKSKPLKYLSETLTVLQNLDKNNQIMEAVNLQSLLQQ